MKTGNRRLNYKPNDQYFTPKWIFESLNITFDLDVASPVNGVDWIPALNYYDEFQDGLIQEWHGCVWMNPPFSNQKPWIEKFINHKNGIALLPWMKSKSLLDIWNKADGITMLPNTLRFELKNGEKKQIFSSVGLFSFGIKSTSALSNLQSKVR